METLSWKFDGDFEALLEIASGFIRQNWVKGLKGKKACFVSDFDYTQLVAFLSLKSAKVDKLCYNGNFKASQLFSFCSLYEGAYSIVKHDAMFGP